MRACIFQSKVLKRVETDQNDFGQIQEVGLVVMACTKLESQQVFEKLIGTGPFNEVKHLKSELWDRFDSIVKRSGLTEAVDVLKKTKSALEEGKPPGYGIVFFAGLKLENRWDIAPGLFLIPYEETWGYCGELLKHSVEVVLFDQPGHPTIERYFFQRENVVVLMKELQWDSLISEGQFVDQADLRFHIEIMETVVDRGLLIVGETKTPAIWTEELISPGVSKGVFHDPGTHKINFVIGEELTVNVKQEIVQTFNAITRLAVSDRNIVSLAIRRYSNALSRSGRFRQEDCILDIAIALEIVYGLDKGELTHKLSARAGWYLGKDYEERNQIRDKIKRFYKLRSCIVHGRKTSRDCKKVMLELTVLYNQTRKVVRQTILKHIDEGNIPREDNWNKIAMGGE